ncbi:MAG: BatD family protein [Elusimicrobia bacterium]|nr:BatD family protein [Elusimicrobiota bacterium]
MKFLNSLKKVFKFVFCSTLFPLPSTLPLAALIFVLPLFAAQSARAALSISAQTDRTELEITENLYLTVTISADSASVPEPVLPAVFNFNAYSSGRSQNISIINGKISTSVSFTYILTPRFIGRQTIPAISAFNGREKAMTPEIEITVTKSRAARQTNPAPSAPPQQGSAGRAAPQGKAPKADSLIFLKAETDRKTAYPGQQINLFIRFYTAMPLTSNPQYLPPAYKNLLFEDLPPVRSGEVTIKGVRYSFSEIKTALFGLSPGPASISPASVIAQLQSDEQIDPFDPNFFQKFFSMNGSQGATKELKTENLTLNILPLPDGAPVSFTGAVGNYTISAELDRKQVKAGEAVNLSVTVSGTGSLKTVTAPKLPELAGFKVFDTMSSLDINKRDDIISGKKVFTTVIVPRFEGPARISPVKFAFFDPEANAYREIETKPLELKVEKGDSDAKNFNFTQPGTQAVSATGSDIRYVSDTAAAPAVARAAGALFNMAWWLNLLPAAALLLSLWFSNIQSFRLRNPQIFKFRRAKATAGKDISRAETELKANRLKEAVSVLYDSFMEYLSDKTGKKVSALTTRQARELIKDRFPRTDEYHLEEIRAFWEQLEMFHFSPSSLTAQNAKDLITKYTVLIEMLEKEFKKK